MDPILDAEKALLAALFRHFGSRLVWTGGSLLQILHHSPRASLDVDLVPAEPIETSDLLAVAREGLAAAGALLGLSFDVTLEQEREGFQRLRIRSSDGGAFSLDVTRLPGVPRQLDTALLESLLGPVVVHVPSPSAL